MEGSVVVIDLGRLRLRMRHSPGTADLFDARVEVDTGVFAGAFDEVFTREDLSGLADALDALGEEGEIALGSGRASEVRLEFLLANSVGPDYVVDCTITRTPDDPQVTLNFLMFGIDRSSVPSSGPLRRLFMMEP